MDSSDFQAFEYSIPRRQQEHGASGADAKQSTLTVKFYSPVDPVALDDPSAVTIIGAHAAGLPKETYEPLWDDINNYVQANGDDVRIRGIWVADTNNADAGESGQDHDSRPSDLALARDLVTMVNAFRTEITHPIVGIGHGAGASALAKLSLLHPQLFAGLVLVEPILQPDSTPDPGMAADSTLRHERWSSRGEAEAAFRRSPLTKDFDPRALQRVLSHGVRESAVGVYPFGGMAVKRALALKTTTNSKKDLRARSQPNLSPSSMADSLAEAVAELSGGAKSKQEADAIADAPAAAPELSRFLASTKNADDGGRSPFRPELEWTLEQLPQLRPRVLYLFGDRSPLAAPEVQIATVESIGAGPGGDDITLGGQVEVRNLPGGGHMLPCERVQDTAATVGNWLARTLRSYRQDEGTLERHEDLKNDEGMLGIGRHWADVVRNASMARSPRAKL